MSKSAQKTEVEESIKHKQTETNTDAKWGRASLDRFFEIKLDQ